MLNLPIVNYHLCFANLFGDSVHPLSLCQTSSRMIQAFCDPFQGFSNCVLFIFCSKVIVVRLLGPCVFPVSRFLKRTWRSTKLQEEEEQTLITNDEETRESGSKMVPKRQTPQMIRVFYKPRTSSSRSDRTSDYTTDEDVPSNPSRHISYGSVDQRLSNGTQSL